jgi:hypothetical protein
MVCLLSVYQGVPVLTGIGLLCWVCYSFLSFCEILHVTKKCRHYKFTIRFWRVLSLVYNTQNHWVFVLCPSFNILETRWQNSSHTESVSIAGEGVEADLITIGGQLCVRDPTEYVSSPSPEERNGSSFLKRCINCWKYKILFLRMLAIVWAQATRMKIEPILCLVLLPLSGSVQHLVSSDVSKPSLVLCYIIHILYMLGGETCTDVLIFNALCSISWTQTCFNLSENSWTCQEFVLNAHTITLCDLLRWWHILVLFCIIVMTESW